jgi:hypothetical protein
MDIERSKQLKEIIALGADIIHHVSNIIQRSMAQPVSCQLDEELQELKEMFEVFSQSESFETISR